MAFNSLCKNKIFKDVPNYEDIKIDKHANELFSSVFTGMGGRYTRLRIICVITEIPMNTEYFKKIEFRLQDNSAQHQCFRKKQSNS